MATFGKVFPSIVDLKGTELILDADADTTITADTDDRIDIKIAGADDFKFTANNFNVLSGSTLTIDSGATITNSGTANNFGTDPESAYAGVLQTNANFVDQVIFGPSVDGMAWNGAWSKASVYSSLMLATLEDEGSNTEINIWDLTEQTSGAISTSPLATIDLSAAATPTSIAAFMGYLIVGSEDGIAIIDPHSGVWAERTIGWPKTLDETTVPELSTGDPVKAVAAGAARQPAFDPRTGGPMPTFVVAYAGGSQASSILKDDGTVFDRAGSGKVAGISNGDAYVNLGDVLYQVGPIDAITADSYQHSQINSSASGPFGLNCDTAFSIHDGTAASADAGGLTFHKINLSNVNGEPNEVMNAIVTRAYNSGYYAKDIRGIWLANSETADRSYKGNTLTKTTVSDGSITEVSADGSSGELKAYRFQSTAGSAISFLKSGAADTDYDFGTADFSVMFWAHLPDASADQYLWSNGYNSSGYTGGGQIAIEQNADESVSLMCSDDNFSTNDSATTGAGLLGGDVWTHVCCYRDGFNIKVAVNGVLAATTALSNAAGTLNNTNSGRTMNIASTFALSHGITDGELALFRVSAGSITSTQIRQSYLAERGMFVADAKVFLQSGSTDAVLDVDVDPLSGKVIVTQTDDITVWDGLAVDSEPSPQATPGATGKGKLWGDLRAEQNGSNAYVTAPATDQRQVNEMVRGLASDFPKGVDLSKAKAWLSLNGAGTIAIRGSFNIKSVTDLGTGWYDVTFSTPFKNKNWAGFVTSGNDTSCQIQIGTPSATYPHSGPTTTGCNLLVTTYAATSGADKDHVWCVFFGELENE